MSEKHSLAKKKQWANKTKEEKTEIMLKVSKGRWAGISAEDRRVHSLKMVAGKNK